MKPLFRRAELHEALIRKPPLEDGDSCNSSLRLLRPGKRMTALLVHLVRWFTRYKPPRRYRVTPRQNAFAFRRALVREAMCELKRDAAFATMLAQRNS